MITKPTILSRAFTRGMAQAFDLTGAIASRRLARFRSPTRVRRTVITGLRSVRQDLVAAERVGWPNHGLRREAAT